MVKPEDPHKANTLVRPAQGEIRESGDKFPGDVASALVDAERNYLVRILRDVVAMKETLASVSSRLNLLEEDQRERISILTRKVEEQSSALEGQVQAQSSKWDNTARQITAVLERHHALAEERAEAGRKKFYEEALVSEKARVETAEAVREDVIRALAAMRRPRHRPRLRSIAGNLLRIPPRSLRHICGDYWRLASSPLFDSDWYLNHYDDVRDARFDPVLHYLLFGAKEHRNPGPLFDGSRYLKTNPDVERAGENPLIHYLRYGASEGRFTRTVADPKIEEIPDRRSNPRFWFFVGDSIEWLKTHPHLTGVGKVSTELLMAALLAKASPIPCAFGRKPLEVIAIRESKEFRDLLLKIGADILYQSASREPSTAVSSPVSGDHIFFTGLVWTPDFTELFRTLRRRHITFSVLVHDIIPIENPELCDSGTRESFEEWLDVTISGARVVFVSGDAIRNKILRWAALRGIDVRSEIVVVPFGLRNVPRSLSRQERALLTSSVELQNFVLSVGTIDARKNQIFLCEIWKRLVDDLGIDRVPQLVLAGRDDLKLAGQPQFASLFAGRKLLVLDGLSDVQISELYRSCLFTAFPSTSEGYGLPVAESLFYGKLCLSTDLPGVREYAKDLAWFFSTDGIVDAVGLFTQAIENPRDRIAAEERIREEFHPTPWTETCAKLISAVESSLWLPSSDEAAEVAKSRYSGAQTISTREALSKSLRWCRSEDPDVSIIVINWNAAWLTLECIRHIWANTDGCTYEIIISDNGSAEGDVARLRRLGSGTRLHELGCNRFFGEASNIAAEHARGRYICLLNNDAFVQPGWLTNLVDALDKNIEVGAAGPLFLFPDGTVQEAGAMMDEGGFPHRLGRGEVKPSAESLSPKVVDYISGAALVLPRDLFLRCGGFDLAFEPAYYEDADLCFKLKLFDRKVLYCPDSRVIHIEGQSANGSEPAETRRKLLGDLNRGKFLARWGTYLRGRDPQALASLGQQMLTVSTPRSSSPEKAQPANRSAAVFTPFSLTPGGGESYLMNCATALGAEYDVSLVTPNPYSRLRLNNLGKELSLDLSEIQLLSYRELAPDNLPDLWLTMGNHVVPPSAAVGRSNIYLCQFPFRMDAKLIESGRNLLSKYDLILAYSEYVRAHINAALTSNELPPIPIAVVPPPVYQVGGDARVKKDIILSVGRFFSGGHSKRHDILIDTFKSCSSRFGQPVELHLAGSSIPDPVQMDYLAQLMASAQGYRVHFHVNPSVEFLHQLYREAAVYWHGTGMGTDLAADPEKAEHFGISIVEAMSAEAVPFSFAAGGPREFIEHGVNGFLYHSPEELAALTVELFAATSAERKQRVGKAAGVTARSFSRECFVSRLGRVLTDYIDAPL